MPSDNIQGVSQKIKLLIFSDTLCLDNKQLRNTTVLHENFAVSGSAVATKMRANLHAIKYSQVNYNF